MEYLRLGNTGLKVSRICLGALPFGKMGWSGWGLSEEQSRPIIQRAVELGINFFDTGNYYCDGASEEVLGRALRDFSSRDQVVIATKVFRPMGDGPNERGLSRKHILSAIEGSLRRLGTDHIDLYQMHRWDYETPIEETLSALNDCVRAGKIRHIGACTMYTWQFAKAVYLSDRRDWDRLVSMQCQHNLLYRENEREMLPFCQAENIGVIAYSPLARGLLVGGRQRMREKSTARMQKDTLTASYYTPEALDIGERVAEIARQRTQTPARIALAWVLREPAITSAIVGATRVDQLEDLTQSFSINLSDDDVEHLNELYKPQKENMA